MAQQRPRAINRSSRVRSFPRSHSASRAALREQTDEVFMRAAIEEAARGIGQTSPNPRVGAVLVKAGRIIARGYHSRAGAPHAEVVALRAAGQKARGADLYITLEPCNHYGRTPPCTEAILRAGVRRVICATLDPYPLVNGRGVARLRRAGVPVAVGPLSTEAARLNRPFFKFANVGLPWVTLKVASSLDGKIATGRGGSRWITGKASREWVHRLRNEVDAILIGSRTARLDNPRLTTRLGRRGQKDSARVVLDSQLRLPATLRLFRGRSKAPTILATLKSASSRKAKHLAALGAEVWSVPGWRGVVDLHRLLEQLAERGFLHVLVEGGAHIYSELLSRGLADELVLFLAPKLIGAEGLTWTGPLHVKEIKESRALFEVNVERLGEDLLVRGLFAPPPERRGVKIRYKQRHV